MRSDGGCRVATGSLRSPQTRLLPAGTVVTSVPVPTDEPWCPTLQDVGQVFAYMGADLQALRCRRLLPPELCPMDTR